MITKKSKNIKDSKRIIEFNENVHDKIYNSYNIKHAKGIFSSIEQNRIKESLQKSINFIDNPIIYKGLDLGCGTGNLTNHLLKLGINVTAADVSIRFLDFVILKYGKKNLLKTLKINGLNLCNINNDTFNIVATYSVLHHIPDYIKIVREMVRICKLGGIIYIDHEVNNSYWNPNKDYFELIKKTKSKIKTQNKNWVEYFKIYNYTNRIIKIMKNVLFKRLPRTNPLNPRYQPDGDIHVWKDDHIEWNKIIKELKDSNFEIIINDDYLFYREKYGINLYNKYKNKCSDYKLLVAKKRK